MDYLINREVSTWDPQFDFSPWDVADGYRMPGDYNLLSTSNERDIQKSVEFKAVAAHARGVQPPIPGTVTIHRELLQDLQDAKAVYVITDVVLARYVKLSVRIGNKTAMFICNRDMPIGFRYKKYRLQTDGTLIAEIPSLLKTLSTEAKWLQPKPQPVPPMPLWDHMRRRYDCLQRKRLRSNLTIPILHEIPDGGDVRFERIIEDNDALLRPGANNVQNVWLNPALPQNEQLVARATMSMETLRGSDEDQEEVEEA